MRDCALQKWPKTMKLVHTTRKSRSQFNNGSAAQTNLKVSGLLMILFFSINPSKFQKEAEHLQIDNVKFRRTYGGKR